MGESRGNDKTLNNVVLFCHLSLLVQDAYAYTSNVILNWTRHYVKTKMQYKVDKLIRQANIKEQEASTRTELFMLSPIAPIAKISSHSHQSRK